MRGSLLVLIAALYGCAATEAQEELGTVRAPQPCRRNCPDTEGGDPPRDSRDNAYASTTMSPSETARVRGIGKYGLHKDTATITVLDEGYTVLGRLEFPGTDATWKHYRYTAGGTMLNVSISEGLLATHYADVATGAWAEYRWRVAGASVSLELVPGSDASLFARHQVHLERALIAIAETSNYVARVKFGWPGQPVDGNGLAAVETFTQMAGSYTDGFCSTEFKGCSGSYTLAGPSSGYGGGYGGGNPGRGSDARGATCSGEMHYGIGFGGLKNLAAERARADANEECTNGTCMGCCEFLNNAGNWERGGGSSNCYCMIGDLNCLCTLQGHGCAT